jgi:exopolysaccharide biosynthesis protein
MKLFHKDNIFGLVYTVALVGFTVYAVLDTFVIPHAYDVVPLTSNNSSIAEYDQNTTSTLQDTQSNSTQITTANANETVVTTATAVGAVTSETVTEVPSENIGDETTTETELTTVTEMTMPENIYASMFNADGSVTITDSSYVDGNMSISLSQYREYDSDIYVADIYLANTSLLKTAFANDKFGRYIVDSTSSIAEAHNAILAINGDYYGSQYDGYVLRNGELYRSTVVSDNEDLAIMKDGTFKIFKETDISAEDLLNSGAQQILAFGPGLLRDYENIIDKDTITGIGKSRHPRCAIGIVDSLHYVFVVVDGRTDQSAGVTAYELAEFMRNIGVRDAYNLDGGGSATLYFNGRVINSPTTHGDSIKQRNVSDIVYIGY